MLSDEWLHWIEEIIAVHGEISLWELQRLVRELEEKGASPYRHTWGNLAGKPWSPEIDAAVAILSLMGRVRRRGDVLVYTGAGKLVSEL